VDTEEELGALKAQAAKADMALFDEGNTSCCYARSDKYWITDPQGIAWEQFHTLGDIPLFHGKEGASCGTATGSSCCPAGNPQAKLASAQACCS
jgi:lactoylglutathione lyase